jgi:uncharacterized membrane protein
MGHNQRMDKQHKLPPAAYQGPDRLDRVLGVFTLVLLAAGLLAVARGMPQWAMVRWTVWLHLAPALLALALTPALLWRRRGDARHRLLGKVWVATMALTAGSSLLVQEIHPGHYSPIHLLSLFTLANLPVVVISAKRGNLVRHRRTLRGIIIGGLVIAGGFTFAFHRLLAHWLGIG